MKQDIQAFFCPFPILCISKLFSPGLQGAITGDLIVFHSLRGRNEASVERNGTLVIFDDFFTLGDDALDGFAGLALRALADDFKDFLVKLRKTFVEFLLLLLLTHGLEEKFLIIGSKMFHERLW